MVLEVIDRADIVALHIIRFQNIPVIVLVSISQPGTQAEYEDDSLVNNRFGLHFLDNHLVNVLYWGLGRSHLALVRVSCIHKDLLQLDFFLIKRFFIGSIRLLLVISML